MAKNDNPHAVRLYESMRMHIGEAAAERIAQKLPLSKSADYAKKFTWAEQVCEALESDLDEDTIQKVRMGCACGPEMGKIKRLQKLYHSASSLDDFAQAATGLNEGYAIEYEQDSLVLVYPQCYCSCVKRVDKALSRAWCYCTLGYTRQMFEHVLGREVKVELLESVKTGGSCCRIRVT